MALWHSRDLGRASANGSRLCAPSPTALESVIGLRHTSAAPTRGAGAMCYTSQSRSTGTGPPPPPRPTAQQRGEAPPLGEGGSARGEDARPQRWVWRRQPGGKGGGRADQPVHLCSRASEGQVGCWCGRPSVRSGAELLRRQAAHRVLCWHSGLGTAGSCQRRAVLGSCKCT